MPGLVHAETLAGMRLGAPVFSRHRLQVRNLAFFAQWDSPDALDEYLATRGLGHDLAAGWHVRMEFVRRWGAVAELAHLPEIAGRLSPEEPVVAVTLARTKLPELARFIHWGRPVERQVRDAPGTTLAMAAMRPPSTFSTFSIWRSGREMTDMVFGRAPLAATESQTVGTDPQLRRHVDAMRERERRDFHREFTTLRFRPLSEHGSWQGRARIVPGLSPSGG